MSTKAPIASGMVPTRPELYSELWRTGGRTGAERGGGGSAHVCRQARRQLGTRQRVGKRSHGRNGAVAAVRLRAVRTCLLRTTLDAVSAATWVRLRAALALAPPVRSARTVPELSPRGALFRLEVHGSAGAAGRSWSRRRPRGRRWRWRAQRLQHLVNDVHHTDIAKHASVRVQLALSRARITAEVRARTRWRLRCLPSPRESGRQRHLLLEG